MIRGSFRRTIKVGNLALRTARDLAKCGKHGEASHEMWERLLNLHCMTNGLSTQILRFTMRRLRPPPKPIGHFTSMLGHFDFNRLNEIAAQIRREGYYIFPERISDALCEAIANTAYATADWKWRRGNDIECAGRIDPEHPVAHRYEMPQTGIWRIPPCQQILGDPIFVNLSQAYFRAMPMLKDVGLWWSAPMDDGRPDDDAAQTFHFDYDATPIWLKFFVYLSDVTRDTGPHVFVKGSHQLRQERARDIVGRGYVRVSDDEIGTAFGPENFVELAGPKGTVFAVDTMGFHKGKPPLAGPRLMMQIECATPLFVPVISSPLPVPHDVDPILLEAYRNYPSAFARFPLVADA